MGDFIENYILTFLGGILFIIIGVSLIIHELKTTYPMKEFRVARGIGYGILSVIIGCLILYARITGKLD